MVLNDASSAASDDEVGVELEDTYTRFNDLAPDADAILERGSPRGRLASAAVLRMARHEPGMDFMVGGAGIEPATLAV